MTAYPEISRRTRDKYHNLEDDEMVKSIFNPGKNKAGIGMKILNWMITYKMKLMENYHIYAAVFGTSYSPKTINSTYSTNTNPILQDTTQLSIAEQKSHDKLEAKQNVEKVEEHLIAEEIEKLVEGTKDVKNNGGVNYVLNNQEDIDTRLEPRSYKESLKVELTTAVQPVNVNEEEEESAEDDYELKRREKGSMFLVRMKFNVLDQHLKEVMEESLPKMIDDRVKELTKTQVLIYVAHGLIMERKHSQDDVQRRLQMQFRKNARIFKHRLLCKLTMLSQTIFLLRLIHLLGITCQLQHDDLSIWLALKIKFEGLQVSNTPCRYFAIRLRDQDEPHGDGHVEGENKHGTYVLGESSSGQNNKSKRGPSTSEVMEESLPKMIDDRVKELTKTQVLIYVAHGLIMERKHSQDDVQRRLQMQFCKNVDSSVRNYMPDNPQLQHDDLSIWLALKIKFEGLQVSNTPCRYFPIRLRDQDEPHGDGHVEGENKHGTYVLGESSSGQDNKSKRGPSTSGHEHKFIIEIIARRANGSIVSMLRLLIVNDKLGVESYQQKVNLTAPTITLPGIEQYKVSFIVSEPHGYVTPSLNKEDVEYMQLFEEEIEERWKHHDQMRRWEMYMNRRPLGSRRERLE
nr:hypothetical protein [Tanacetum cinerariifolium]